MNKGYITPKGYRRIWHKGRLVMEHRFIMEQYLGKEIPRSHDVHHINGNKLDNRIENLKVIKHNTHTLLHSLKSVVRGNKKLCLECQRFLNKDLFYVSPKGHNRPYCNSCQAKRMKRYFSQ